MVAELAAVDPASISGPIWRQSVKQARIAAAHLLRTRCGLSEAETARHLGKSDQAISHFTTQAKHSIASAGRIYDLIAAADAVLWRTESLDSTARDHHHSRTNRARVPHLRRWRRSGPPSPPLTAPTTNATWPRCAKRSIRSSLRPTWRRAER